VVYAGCWLVKAEGEQQIDAFLRRLPEGGATLDAASPGASLALIDNPGSDAITAASTGTGSIAAPAAADGFYYARLHKR
jgi:16S rRNA C967 or C1407 C5-methylase (RsmB/RsmF family)